MPNVTSTSTWLGVAIRSESMAPGLHSKKPKHSGLAAEKTNDNQIFYIMICMHIMEIIFNIMCYITWKIVLYDILSRRHCSRAWPRVGSP